MDERITGILMRLCLLFGAKRLADLLIDGGNSETEEKFIESFSKFIEKLEKKFNSKLFEFHDRTQQSVIKFYVIQCRADMTMEGEPTIVLNDFPLGLKGEKNPVLNLVLVYDDVEVRDKDLEDLKFMIS
jgi:hypothetical protein